MAEIPDCPVVKAWMDMPVAVARAVEGKLAHVHKDSLDRQCVADNADFLEPLIREFGTLAE